MPYSISALCVSIALYCGVCVALLADEFSCCPSSVRSVSGALPATSVSGFPGPHVNRENDGCVHGLYVLACAGSAGAGLVSAQEILRKAALQGLYVPP